MARLVTKFKYLKAGDSKKVGGYAKYIATREGVEKIDESFRLSPASGKQKDLIRKILRDFPDAKDMHEYEDYVATPNMGNASEFISRAIEDNAHSAMGRKTYADYIATRPRAERFGSHGLFTDDGVQVKLDKVSEELNLYDGNVWTVILSLRREDAMRLGYDSGKRWRDMLRTQTENLSTNFKIPMSNLRWYAAFHNEGHHPHVHLIVYSVAEKEGYLTEQGVHNLRSAFARDIFAQDLLCVYEKQTEYRDELRRESSLRFEEIIKEINEGQYNDPAMEEKLVQLADRLSKTKGKKQYGYLKADVKALVCSIVDGIASDERITALYDLWYEQREEVIRTYTQEIPPRVPLSQNQEFKSIRNAVIREAMNIVLGKVPITDDEQEAPPLKEPTLKEIEGRYRGSIKTLWELYDWAKILLESKSEEYDPNKAVQLLTESALRGNTVAKYRLGSMYLRGDGIPKDIDFALFWLNGAVKDGNHYAEYLLGKLFLFGEGLKSNPERGKELLKHAAEAGNDHAAYIIGKALLDGELVSKDVQDAMRYLTQAADNGFAPAQFLLGRLLYRGTETERNVGKALEYLEKAAKQGSPQAAYFAGKIRLQEDGYKDIGKAITLLTKACGQQGGYAEFRLGLLYLKGDDVRQDMDAATKYLSESSELGNEYAKQILKSIETDRQWYAGMGVVNLFRYMGRMIENELKEEKPRGRIERKLWRKIAEKKEDQGLKHG